MPDAIIIALLAVAVFCKANADIRTATDHWPSWTDVSGATTLFMIKDNWGKEDDIRDFMKSKNTTRVMLEGLDELQHYIVEGTGPPIVFVHGFGLDNRMWESQMKYFSADHTTIAVDLRGFGKSTPPKDQPFAYHEDIAELLEFLQIDQRVTLVGHSMGARAVANFALTYPEKTRAVVFVDAAIEGYKFADFDLSGIYQAGKTQGVRAANQMWLDHAIFDSARQNPVVAQQLNGIIMSYSGWHYINKVPLKNMAPPAYEQLENIRSPALIVTGEYDLPDFKTIALTLHDKITGSVKIEIAGAGHMCNMENPDQFNKIFSQFLKTC